MTFTTPSAPSGTAGTSGNEQINPFGAVVHAGVQGGNRGAVPGG